MTLKERLHPLVEELPEEALEAMIESTENALQRYRETTPSGQAALESANGAGRVNGILWTRPTPEMMKERAVRVRATSGKYAHVPTSSEDYYHRKHDDRLLEEEQSARRIRGEG